MQHLARSLFTTLLYSVVFCRPPLVTVNHGTGEIILKDLNKNGPPERPPRMRILVNRIQMSEDDGTTTVHQIQLRWTPPELWYDEGADAEERTYQVECLIQETSSEEERVLIDIEVPDVYTGYDERFRLPDLVFEVRCSVRARNGLDLPSEWTPAPKVNIDNRDSYSKSRRNTTTASESEFDQLLRITPEAEDMSEKDLLKLIHESQLEDLTPKVDIQKYKAAGRLQNPNLVGDGSLLTGTDDEISLENSRTVERSGVSEATNIPSEKDGEPGIHNPYDDYKDLSTDLQNAVNAQQEDAPQFTVISDEEFFLPGRMARILRK